MIGESLERKRLAEFGALAGSFLLHTSAAMIVGPIITGIVGYVFGILSYHLKAIGEIGEFANPLIWGPGFVLGFLLSYVTRQRAACWVWLCGLVWIAVGILDSVRYYDPRYSQGCSDFENVLNAFFIMNSHRCGGGSSTLAGLLFTLPAVSSVAYAVGAWVAIRYMGRFYRIEEKQTTTPGLN